MQILTLDQTNLVAGTGAAKVLGIMGGVMGAGAGAIAGIPFLYGGVMASVMGQSLPGIIISGVFPVIGAVGGGIVGASIGTGAGLTYDYFFNYVVTAAEELR